MPNQLHSSSSTSLPPFDARLMMPITRLPHLRVHDQQYYINCMIGGILSCGLTHTAIVPLDVVKCKMQVFPEKYKGLISSIRTVIKEETSLGLIRGWSPTLLGYSMQGLFKFGFYEIFKDLYANLLGEWISGHYQGRVWVAASASAEVIADIALCPMEMVKVKIQTSPVGTWPSHLLPATQKMLTMRQETRFPFGSLIPLWSRQIPYTVAKFFFFEKIVQSFYTYLFVKPKNQYTKTTQLGITFASGYLAGIICALVSQPPDTIVSNMGKASNKGKSFMTIAKEVGIRDLFLKGLGTRVLMVGTLTGLQWWIFDTYKTMMGMGTTGGAAIKK